MNHIRTRFAPSPTGYLHIGGLRTSLFAYLIAKSDNTAGEERGVCILRIEDTDQKRHVEGAKDKLIQILNWAGLNFDEGPHAGGEFGPYVQSERKAIYKEYAKKLLDNGSAYPCFCTPERLAEMREKQTTEKKPPRYDRCCRDLPKNEAETKVKNGETFVIRQKMPLEGNVTVYDELRGEIKFKAQELEDQVLMKTDGFPTYHLAVVVDDHLMNITHVVRGDDWIPSFPKNALLYNSFGWELPKFLHLPLTLNKGGGKLSKRQGDVSVEDYKSKGYLPEALINFCASLGWHPKEDEEIFSLDDLIKKFKIEDMGVSPSVFDIEKLDYLNGYYIRKKEISVLTELCLPFLEENIKKADSENQKDIDFIKKVVAAEQERLKKLSEIGELTEFFFKQPEYEADLLIWKKMTKEDALKNLSEVIQIINAISEDSWSAKEIEEKMFAYLKAHDLKTGEYLWPMRAALSGRKASPGPFEIAEILGKKEVAERLTTAANKLK